MMVREGIRVTPRFKTGIGSIGESIKVVFQCLGKEIDFSGIETSVFQDAFIQRKGRTFESILGVQVKIERGWFKITHIQNGIFSTVVFVSQFMAAMISSRIYSFHPMRTRPPIGCVEIGSFFLVTEYCDSPNQRSHIIELCSHLCLALFFLLFPILASTSWFVAVYFSSLLSTFIHFGFDEEKRAH